MAGENPSQVLEATTGFAADIEGERYIVNAHTTRISADHILAQRYPQHFRPVDEDLSFRTEEATANPGEARDRTAARAGSTPQKSKED